MNKRFTFLIHVAVWLLLLLWPILFISRDGSISLREWGIASMSPFLMMVVFYVNYLWLCPTYFVGKGNRYVYWLVNALLCVAFGILMHFWMTHFRHPLPRPNPRHEPGTLQLMMFIIRNIGGFVIAAAIATAVYLSARWRQSEAARRDAEAARVKAELTSLRWSVSPHFLLNTLNNIYALIPLDASRAQQAVLQLSAMLRHVLYESNRSSDSSSVAATSSDATGGNLVPLDEEIKFLESYVSLMKLRLSSSVEVTFTHTTVPRGSRVAPLIFISLVENAFKHGVSATEPSFIHITLTATADGQIVFETQNSNHPKDAQDRSGHGIGLRQVQNRLDLCYPQRYTWQYGPTPDAATYKSCITLQTS